MQRPFVILFVIALAGASLSSQSPKRTVTLNIVDQVNEPDGTATITLASGRKITVSAADFVVTPPAPKPLLTVEDVIKDKCTRDSPNDPKTQMTCQTRQHSAVMAISARQVATTKPEYAIVHAACEKQFPDDYVLRNLCEEQQMKVLRH